MAATNAAPAPRTRSRALNLAPAPVVQPVWSRGLVRTSTQERSGSIKRALVEAGCLRRGRRIGSHRSWRAQVVRLLLQGLRLLRGLIMRRLQFVFGLG